ncbi:MAG: hypothetical protein KF813_09950 [Trueperaceae bacterium]|nr:hypothetical protein [Trueperaceae bacterium]
MERREARRLLEKSTDFKFEGDKVVLRDPRIIAATQASARELDGYTELPPVPRVSTDARLSA